MDLPRLSILLRSSGNRVQAVAQLEVLRLQAHRQLAPGKVIHRAPKQAVDDGRAATDANRTASVQPATETCLRNVCSEDTFLSRCGGLLEADREPDAAILIDQ